MALTKVSYGVISADASSIDLNIDANTLYIDSSANKVGIGTTSPSKQLTVSGDDCEVLFNRTGSYADTINFGMPSGVPTIVGGTDLAFGGTGTWTEHMRLKADGKLGLGTSAPDNIFHLYAGDSGATLTDARYKAIIEHSGEAYLAFASTANSFAGVRFVAPSGQKGYIDYYHGSQGDKLVYSATTAHSWNIGANAKMFLSSGGNLGLGTTSPNALIDLSGASASASPKLRFTGTGNASAGDVIGQIDFYNSDDTDYTPGVMGSMRAIAGPSGGEGHLQFLTDMPSEGAAASNVTLHLHSNGRVGIGTTSPEGTFHVSGSSLIMDTPDGSGLELRRTGNSAHLHLFPAYSSVPTIQGQGAGGLHLGYNSATAGIRINTSNNVGIGTTSPAAKLHISGNSDTSDEDCMLIIDDVDGSAGSRIPAIMFRSNTGGSVTNQARIRGTDTQGLVMSGSGALGDDLVVQAGKVGIGTTSPDARLTVNGAANSEQMIITGNSNQSRGLSISTRTNNAGSGGQQDAEVFLNAQDTENAAYAAVALGYAGNEVLRVQQIESSGATGAVGINEVSPAYTLDVNTNGESNAMRLYQGTNGRDLNMLLQNQGTGSGDDSLVSLYTANAAGDPKIRWAISGQETWEMGIDNSDSDQLKISNGSALGTDDIIAITGSGLGIGQTSPAKLGLTGSSAGKVLHMGGDDCQIRLANSILHHDNSGNTILHLRNNYGATSSSAQTKIESGFTTFHTGTSFDERIRIDDGGRLLLNQTSSNLTYGKLQVTAGGEASGHGGIAGFFDTDVSVGSGNVIQVLWFSADNDATGGVFTRFRDGNSIMGQIEAANGTQVSYGVSSDERLKKNIVDASSQLNTIKNIKVREFDWKANDYHEVGMIAQELNSVVPSAVQEGGDDIDEVWGVDYSKLTPYLIKAVQELSVKLEAAEARIKTLESK